MREKTPRISNTEEGCFWATMDDWLNETEEIAVQRQSSRISQLFVVNSVDQARKLIRQCSIGDEINLIRGKPFPIRGYVDQAFISSVEKVLPSAINFVVLRPTYFPTPLDNYLGSGNGCAVVARVLENYLAQYVWVGESIWVPAIDDAKHDDCHKYLWARVQSAQFRGLWKLW